MIKPNATLSIACIPLDKIQVKEFQQRFPEKLNLYIQLLTDNPDDYAGFLSVAPSETHEGMYRLHRTDITALQRALSVAGVMLCAW